MNQNRWGTRRTKSGADFYEGRNFGTLELDYSESAVMITSTVRDIEGRVKLQAQQKLDLNANRRNYACLDAIPPVIPHR